MECGSVRHQFIGFCVLVLGLFVASQSVYGHHGSSAFDTGKRLTLKGTVTEWFWANPHCFLKFDVKNTDTGDVAHWVAETSNPPDMINLGWSKQSFKPGDQVAVTLEPVKNGRQAGRVLDVVLPDGRTLHASGKVPNAVSGSGNGNNSANGNKY
jgi:hypothetical protein